MRKMLEDWRDSAKNPERAQAKLDILGAFTDEMPLMSLEQALVWRVLSTVERQAIRWLHRHDGGLDAFALALWDAITFANEDQLENLARAYPHEVEAVRRWRNDPAFVNRLRGLPFDFNLRA